MTRTTLKERYEQKNQVLIETLILREFNQDLIQNAVQVFKALQSVNFSGAGLKTLASARDSAINDVDSVLAGKSNKGLIRRFISLFKQKENPLIDAFAFCDALRNFFYGLIQYVEARKTNVPNADNLTLRDLIVGDIGTRIDNEELSKEKFKNLQDLIIKGFKPDGPMRKLSKSWQKKYLKSNFTPIAKDLMNAKVSNIETIGKQVIDAMQNASAIARGLLSAQDIANTSTQRTTGPEQTTASQPTSGSGISDRSNNKPSGGVPPTVNPEEKKKANDKADELYKGIQADFGNLDPDVVKNVIAVLAYNDLLKSKSPNK